MSTPTNMRQDRRTTKQMIDAPRNAVFVWCNGITDYPQDLARSLGRTDLRIVTPMWMHRGGWQGMDLRPEELVLDHAYNPTASEAFSLDAFLAQARRLDPKPLADVEVDEATRRLAGVIGNEPIEDIINEELDDLAREEEGGQD